MGYHIYLYRKEVKEQNTGPEFMENEDSILPFSEKQYQNLKGRLLKYGFKIEKENDNSIEYNFKSGESFITAFLTNSCLAFKSGFTQDAIFEISMTASEFTDSGEFAKLDPQDGGWEKLL